MQKKTETQENMDNIHDLLFDRTDDELRQVAIMKDTWLQCRDYGTYLRTSHERLSREDLSVDTVLLAGYWAKYNKQESVT